MRKLVVRAREVGWKQWDWTVKFGRDSVTGDRCYPARYLALRSAKRFIKRVWKCRAANMIEYVKS